MKNITEQDFPSILSAERLQVVMFQRETGCSNCEAMRPLFEKFAERNPMVECHLYTVEGNPAKDPVAVQYPFRVFPGVCYFSEGQLVGQLEGVFHPDLFDLPLMGDAEIKSLGFDHADLAARFDEVRSARYVLEACKRTIALRAQAASRRAKPEPEESHD